ncbi:TonB-dependent receptor [Spirosoma montaniterrae]|uniref:Prevent-host-death protein n=1 Tax=Spirosoma montaniterrae TaxID=1178516 RepID=A0A1P9WUZ1_9BACT|nr:TonB-dependent receptor [Spirosoma montaniterrae]AQG79197.1 prevent-host-death protein [Spirosoma montaniterrae]
MIRFTLTFLFATFLTTVRAQFTQTIRGSVLDEASKKPIAFASIVILNTTPFIGASTDETGTFLINNVPVGRYDLQVTVVGYEPAIVREVTVGSGKQTFLTIHLNENVALLNEISVKPRVSKERPLNTMATVSAKMLSVEEAKRYAGGFDDPARLASVIAGVAGNMGDNGIIVRGNAPKFLQWRMEGVEIPSPNHFGDLNYLGGGILTALSSQMLTNSDFLTGAFPAEYNNALSGVFDVTMRTGSNQKRESTIQLGVLGLENASEGPFKKGGRSSYLYNYRYATLALLKPLLPEDAESITYQDLSFKMNFPTRRAGTFSVWGMGFRDGASAKPKKNRNEWTYPDDNEDNVIRQSTGVVGVGHTYIFKDDAYWKTTVTATANEVDWTTQKMDNALELRPYSKIANTNWNGILSSYLNKKFSTRHTNRTGITLNSMHYDILLNKARNGGDVPQDIVNANGQSMLLSGYSSSSIYLTNKLVMNAGVNAQLFTLNNRYTVEPRIGVRHQINANHILGLAYGLHSRLEKLNYYFNNSLTTGEKAVNKTLDFSKAHHLVLSYDWNLSELVHLKIEPYYQQLFSIPVIPDSSFSFINLQSDLFFGEKLQNTGVGRNYGIDLMLEKYVSKGYYYLLSGSLFNAEYKGGDGIWRNTRFNRRYVVNFLIGKEWATGRAKQNTLSLNTRLSYQGGNWYSPVDETASVKAKMVVYDETNAFSLQSDPLLHVHFTAIYRINRKKRTSEIALKLLNLTQQPDFRGHLFNQLANTVDQERPTLSIPNLSYKVEF